MSIKEDFSVIKENFEKWLEEFLTSPHADLLTEYQKDKIGRMIVFSVTLSKENGLYPSSWTGEKVVDLVVNHVCQTLPEEDAFYEAYPFTMSVFLEFLAEKEYLPKGKEIGQSLLAAKEDIFQTEETRNQLARTRLLIQEGRDAGVDFSDPEAAKQFIDRKIYEEEIINAYFEKKESGMSTPEIMDQMTPEERDILMKDMFRDVPEEFDPEAAQKGLKILETELAKGKSLEEASKKVPEKLLSSVLNSIRPHIMDGSLSQAKEPFVKQEKKVGRNTPCPCGSGKKYKKCCLRK